jgi:AcrR family transcriptional regulator
VTVECIVAASVAPKKQLYHRFSAVDDLLAAMWLRAVRQSQDRFLQQLTASGDAVEAAVAAGLALHDFATQEPADARLLAALRREDLAGEVSDPRSQLRCMKLTIDCRRR